MTSLADAARDCAALRTRMAARSVTRAYNEALRPLGLMATQFSLLAAIKQGAPDSISRLADWLAIERSTLTRNLQVLEKDGLIEVGPEGYRRARVLTLTEAGEAKLAAALPLWRQTQDRLEAKLGKRRWREARALLEELSTAL